MVNDSCYLFHHSYTACDLYNITVTVENDVTASQSETVEVKVPCPLSMLTVTPRPSSTTKGIIYLSNSSSLQLTVSLATGSFVNYTINWGDGHQDIEEQISQVDPTVFIKKHFYGKIANYNVTVDAASTVNESDFIKNTLKVFIIRCAAPVFTFPYGKLHSPIVITQGIDFQFVASWVYDDKECEKLGKENLDLKKWEIVFPNGSKRNFSVSENSNLRSVEFRVAKHKYGLGLHKITLHVSYNSTNYEANGYFEIKQSNLVIQIRNGVYQKIPWQVLGEDGNRTFYEFQLIGTDSFDPDNRTAGSNLMIFRWECRVNATSSDFLKEVDKRRKNATNVSFECLHEEFQSVNISAIKMNGVVGYNTEGFLEGFQYEFKVIVTKGSRNGSFVQKLTFAEGSPPKIDLV